MSDAPERIGANGIGVYGETDHGGTEYIRADLAATDAQVMAQSAIDVLAERQRQIGKEGWDEEHDDDHSDGEMAAAACCYAFAAAQRGVVRVMFREGMLPPMWPEDWDVNWWKPTTPRRDLVKAAALILAEIDRLDRAALRDLEAAMGDALELKPCPFCGGAMEDRGYGVLHLDGRGCPIGDLAIDAVRWNTRADLADAQVMAHPKVRKLVEACFAEIDARAMYLATAPDRGGMHGPKGQRKQALDAAQLRTIAALRDLGEPT